MKIFLSALAMLMASAAASAQEGKWVKLAPFPEPASLIV